MEHLHVASQRSRLAIAVSTVVALIAALILVISPSRSLAAGTGDQIYWSREQGNDSIRVGPLGGSTAQTLFNDSGRPCGIAANPAEGLIYWANWDTGEIRVGNLNGGGASTLFDEPGNLCGVAVDPTAGLIYWANFSTSEIRVGNLDGTGATTLFTEPDGSGPSGVAIDPAAGKIYWTNQPTDQVRVGDLDDPDSASTLFGNEDNPIGVAIDTAASKLYWTDLQSGFVRTGNLDGSGAQTLFSGESPSGPAIDPTTNKIYWTSWTISGLGIRVGPLTGDLTIGPADDAQTLFPGESAALFAAILKTPAGAGVPAVSSAGGQLSCSQGSWAPDLLGAFLYRAPEDFAYQWLLDGNEVGGATTSTYTPTAAGDYTCTVTASNHAGSASQTSAPWTIYDWSGFFAPVKNRDGQGHLIFNSVKAGASVAVKFSLHGNLGLGVFADGYPKSETIPCNSTEERNGIEPTDVAGQTSLSYDPATDTYTYVWKTQKAWGSPSTCRQLVVQLDDGTFHRANFKFVK